MAADLSVSDLGAQQRVKNRRPVQVAIVARLDLLADADQRLLEVVLAARVQHLLLYRRRLRTPAASRTRSIQMVHRNQFERESEKFIHHKANDRCDIKQYNQIDVTF